tara:strand:- start:952 stop:1665 length:714 start_codon:yes stop_codon:yes gene_type:complete
MARISTYIIDTAVTLLDKWIGTDSSGGATKNFTAKSIADLFNEKGSIGVVNQNNFLFQTDLIGGRKPGTISFTAGGGSNTSFSALTTIKISKYASSTNLILNYLETLVSKPIMLAQLNDLNNFGVYKLDSLTQDVTETDFYNANFTLIESNGFLLSEKTYGIVAYSAAAVDQGDLHFTYNQVAASGSWAITHNLGKNPSVSIVDSGGNTVVGDVIYINTNQLTINFTAQFSGKAYLN